MERYSRQVLLAEIGTAGQARLRGSAVSIVGCGALGTVVASTVVRAGVGKVRIIDRDYIELNNLQRQILFDEEDIVRGLPKAVAAAEKLVRINSQAEVEPIVADVNADNVEQLIRDADLVFDGTDNFETRFLLNDACVKVDIPWVYAGVLSTYGMTMAIIPHRTACFRCLVAEMPVPGSVATCDTVGVLGAAVNVVASLGVVEGLKILMGREEELHGRLLYVDAWSGSLDRMRVTRDGEDCPACGLGRFEFLEARQGSYLTRLCGREAVQVNVRGEASVSLDSLAERLASAGEVAHNDHMLRFRVGAANGRRPYELTVFPDGRAIVKGTTDEAEARTIYSKYVGL